MASCEAGAAPGRKEVKDEAIFLRRYVREEKMPWLLLRESNQWVRLGAFSMSIIQLFADIICFFLSVFRGSVISWVVNPLFIASALAGIYGSCVIATWLVFAHILISSAMIVTIVIAVLVLGFGSNEWTLALIHLPTLVDIVATIPSIVMMHRLRKFNRDRKLATVRPAADVPMEPPGPVATVATPAATPATTPGVNAAAAAAAPPQPQQDSKCIACMERDRNIVFVPCGHLVMCEACSLKLLETTDRDHAVCPVCRAEITDFVKTFK